MKKRVVLNIGRGLDVTTFCCDGGTTKHVLAFHGGGGVNGSPDMLAAFATELAASAQSQVWVARYRTLAGDQATFEQMRSDAAHALEWAVNQSSRSGQLYLLGASFGGLLALDALLEATHDVQSQVSGLILLNAVTDVSDTGWSNKVVNVAAHGCLSPQKRLAKHPLLAHLTCFVAHADQDTVIPIATARQFVDLWPADRCELHTFPKAGHGFFNRAPHIKTVAKALRAFIEQKSVGPIPSPMRKTNKNIISPDGATLLYGIGAQKAGTSWLFDCLAQSKECHVSPTKELHYFDALYVKSESSHIKRRQEQLRRAVECLSSDVDAKNRKHLKDAQVLIERLSIHATTPGDHRRYVDYLCKGHWGEKIICDFTPSYCTLDRAGFAEMDSIGSAKFIFVLRDPVDRMWSQIRMAVSAENPNLSDAKYTTKCIAAAEKLLLDRDMSRIPRANYRRTMTELEAAVPSDRIYYAFYETLFTQDSVDHICAFLGISPISITAEKRVNTGRCITLPSTLGDKMAKALAPQYTAARARFGSGIPQNWRDISIVPNPGAIASISNTVQRIGHKMRGSVA